MDLAENESDKESKLKASLFWILSYSATSSAAVDRTIYLALTMTVQQVLLYEYVHTLSAFWRSLLSHTD